MTRCVHERVEFDHLIAFPFCFCFLPQIFYPFSIQTHPNEFPGADPGDCPRDIKKEQ